MLIQNDSIASNILYLLHVDNIYKFGTLGQGDIKFFNGVTDIEDFVGLNGNLFNKDKQYIALQGIPQPIKFKISED